jgi:hypothetical protein
MQHIYFPNYFKNALHTFQYPKASRPTHAPSKWNSPTYGQKVQYTDIDDLPDMGDDQRKFLQRVVGKFLFYARAVDPTMQHALNWLAAAQSKGTQATVAALVHFLNYCETHPYACIRYEASDMILRIHSDASYLTEPGARSRAGGHFYLSKAANVPPPPLNGPIQKLVNIIRAVMSSAAEAEVGALILNCKEGVGTRITLEEMGHPQPPTLVQVDNSTACGIANESIRQLRSRAMDMMRVYWIQDRVCQNQFQVYWVPGTDNVSDYYTKDNPAKHHQVM